MNKNKSISTLERFTELYVCSVFFFSVKMNMLTNFPIDMLWLWSSDTLGTRSILHLFFISIALNVNRSLLRYVKNSVYGFKRLSRLKNVLTSLERERFKFK